MGDDESNPNEDKVDDPGHAKPAAAYRSHEDIVHVEDEDDEAGCL